MGQIRSLFNLNRDEIKVGLHGYGVDKLRPSLHDVISEQISPFALGETDKRFGTLLKKIYNSDRVVRKDKRTIILLFVSGSLFETKKDISVIRDSVEQLTDKGYRVMVIPSSPNFNEKEAIDIFPQETNILNPVSPNLFPALLPTLERSIADIAIGKSSLASVPFITVSLSLLYLGCTNI